MPKKTYFQRKQGKDTQPKKARQRDTTKESKTKRHTENESSSGLGEMETAALKEAAQCALAKNSCG